VKLLSRTAAGLLLIAIFLIAGCAHPPRVESPSGIESQFWRGRLGLRVDSEPPQSFSAGFELSGDADQGTLRLFSPLGTTLADLRWSPQSATLSNNGETRQFESLDALATQATGTAIPIAALFQWLTGVQTGAAGWSADLSQLESGRLTARRTQPLPAAELRLILER
jgi:outer membrane lipoprotein LolB